MLWRKHSEKDSNTANHILYSVFFILLFLITSISIMAQEPFIIEIKKGEEPIPIKGEKVLIYSEGDTIIVDDSNNPKLNSRAGKESPDDSKQRQDMKERRSQQNERTDVKFSPEERNMNREIKKDMKDTIKSEGKERPQDKIVNPPNSPDSKRNEERNPKESNPSDAGLKRYLDTVVNKNLFLPLGTGPEEKKSSYAVTGVISSNNRNNDKAIIEEIGSRKGYYVSEGDRFAENVEVVEISEMSVKLNRSGEQMSLRLGEGTSKGAWGGGGGGPRGGRPGGEEKRPDVANVSERQNRRGSGQDNFDPSQIPPFALEILKQRGISIEDLKNNPDLREKLRSEFMEQIRRGGMPMGMDFRQGERGRRQDR